ncbi:MAG TPA: hypothetical protein VFI90_18590 [Rubrobacter sp.]|nr:hypothetical protein [Rubrobacter sp.]
MSSRGTSWLAWSLAALSVVMFVGSAALWVLAHSTHVPRSLDADLTTGGLLGQALFLVFPLVGALIASRRPENPIGWLCLVDGLLWTTTDMLDYHSVYGMASPGSVPFLVGLAGVNHWLWVPTVGLLGTYVFLLFPDGRLPSRRWRPLAWLSGVVIASESLGLMLSPGPLDVPRGIRNPFGLEAAPWVAVAAYATLPLLPLCMLASVLSLVMRYRRSRGDVRQQIKWIAVAASLVALTYLIAIVALFIHPSEIWFAAGLPLWLDFIEYAALLSITSVPIAIGFAVLKYRLYDLDLIINRTLVYGLLTALLAAGYVATIMAFQGIGSLVYQVPFRTLFGQESALATVAATLAMAALFNPLRRRIQSFIDRRFYRRKYDAIKTLEAFSVKLRDATDQDALSDDLVGVVRETVQPAHVSIWLRPDEAPRRDAQPP